MTPGLREIDIMELEDWSWNRKRPERPAPALRSPLKVTDYDRAAVDAAEEKRIRRACKRLSDKGIRP